MLLNPSLPLTLRRPLSTEEGATSGNISISGSLKNSSQYTSKYSRSTLQKLKVVVETRLLLWVSQDRRCSTSFSSGFPGCASTTQISQGHQFCMPRFPITLDERLPLRTQVLSTLEPPGAKTIFTRTIHWYFSNLFPLIFSLFNLFLGSCSKCTR